MGAPSASVGPSGKRKGDARGDAVRQKKAKLYAARTIAAQPADAGLRDGELDLQAFLAAHEFEIRSLEESMARSKAVGASRAFQQVPRGLRRRTASHNPKRVPRRLRLRARREMQEDKTPIVEARKRRPRTTRARIRAQTAKRLGLLAARRRRRMQRKAEAARKAGIEHTTQAKRGSAEQPKPKIRRNQLNEPPKATSKFRKRQLNKTWLPTHKWHAKRARMTEPTKPLWRFAIPLTPNEKIYRPTHRAQGQRGTMIWDTSYVSTIGLYGKCSGIEKILKAMGVSKESCWNERGKKWRLGSRAWTGLLSRQQQGHTRLICPATILWNPEPISQGDSADAGESKRQLYIRLNPAAFLETFTELVCLCKMKGSGVYVEDLRFEIGSVTLTGPASTEALSRILEPWDTESKPKNKHAGLFEAIKLVTNPASLPANAVLGFFVQDPRLRHPPRKAEVVSDANVISTLANILADWPAEGGLEPYGLFDRRVRLQAAHLPSQRAIYKRKSLAAPGSAIEPSQTDPPIPVILVASRSPASLQAQGTWTLLMPWKCILPLWYSAVHCPLFSGGTPRFGGLNELMQVSFERGTPWFPADFVATKAGADWELQRRQDRLKEYNRRPKSKRVDFAQLDLGAGRKGEIGDGLACDFELLFGLARPQTSSTPPEPQLVQADKDATDVNQSDFVSVEVVDKAPSAPPPSPSSLELLRCITQPDFRAMASSTATANTTDPSIPPNAITTVRITLLSRGVVKPCARIYRLPAAPPSMPASSSAEVPATIPPLQPQHEDQTLPRNLRAQWLTKTSRTAPRQRPQIKPLTMEQRKRLLAQELTGPPRPYPPPKPNAHDIGGHHPLVPDADDLVGFVTTGSYCLRDGRAAALGSIAVEKALLDLRRHGKEAYLCIVRNAGEQVGWIARWEAV